LNQQERGLGGIRIALKHRAGVDRRRGVLSQTLIKPALIQFQFQIVRIQLRSRHDDRTGPEKSSVVQIDDPQTAQGRAIARVLRERSEAFDFGGIVFSRSIQAVRTVRVVGGTLGLGASGQA
jgi:hypothetical protein